MKKSLLTFAISILILSNCLSVFASKNTVYAGEEYVFLVVFDTFDITQKEIIKDKIAKINGVTVLQFCETKKAFLCTANKTTYNNLGYVDREVHNPELTLPKCFLKELTQNDINRGCE